MLGDLADCTYTTVRVNPGEDVICCLLVAIGILESQRLALLWLQDTAVTHSKTTIRT